MPVPPRRVHQPPPPHKDGSLATWLEAVLASTGLMQGMRVDSKEDVGDEPWTAGRVRYVAPAGGGVTATVQRTARRLDDQVFTYGGQCGIEILPSGTEAVLREVDARPASFAQVILRRADGVFAQVTAGGLPGRGVVRPLTREQVRGIAQRIDAALDQDPPRWPGPDATR